MADEGRYTVVQHLLLNRGNIMTNPTHWKCRDGRSVAITAMTESHITNCLAMLKRKGFVSTSDFDLAWLSAGGLQGEMATYYAEQQLADMRPSSVIDAFEEELERRRRAVRAAAGVRRLH